MPLAENPVRGIFIVSDSHSWGNGQYTTNMRVRVVSI